MKKSRLEFEKDKNEYKYYKRKTPPLQATGNSIYREMTNYFNENQVEEVNYNAFTLDELFTYYGTDKAKKVKNQYNKNSALFKI